MLVLISTVLISSVLGSLHCAGMCGAFVAFAVGIEPKATSADAPKKHWIRRSVFNSGMIGYNGGRLVTYSILGLISGLVGRGINIGADAVGVQHAAMILAGATMMVAGSITLLRLNGVRVPRMPLPKPMAAAFQKGTGFAMRLPRFGRAFTVGLLTTLLPCGWLYAFAVVAAGTASPWYGALTMAAFWVGTLPMMVTIGAGVRGLTGRFGRRVPVVMATIIIGMGVMTMFSRGAIQLTTINEVHALANGSLSPVIDRARTLTSTALECCDVDEPAQHTHEHAEGQ